MKKAYVSATLIDTKNRRLVQNTTIFVENGKISDVQQNAFVDSGWETADLTGKYIMAGLVNPHVHLFGTGKPSKIIGGGKAQQKLIRFINTKAGGRLLDALVASGAKTQLLSGVTTVRAVGDFIYSDVRLRDKINAGKADGPRLLVSGPAITVTGGHGYGTFAITADEPEELKKLVNQNADKGVDLIKICITGGVTDAKKRGEPGEARMNLEQTKAVCDAAHARGLKVASHTQSAEGMKIAAQAGVDTIEHGSISDGETLDSMAQRNAAVVLTYSPAVPLAALPADVVKLSEICRYNSQVVIDNMTAGGRAAREKGILVGIGTDSSCSFATQYNMWRELVLYTLLMDADNFDALKTATYVNAQIAGAGDIAGEIAVGKSADMLVLNGNPVDDLDVLSRPEIVIARGKEFKNPKPKKLKSVERELVKVIAQLRGE